MKPFKIIATRVLVELFLTFMVMQVGFTLIFVIIGIFLQDVLSKMPLTQVPMLIPYIFPFAQSFCGQLVMVFTCVMIYSRITQSHEVLALQSSGISSWRLMAPSFWLAFLMSILCFWMADLDCSWGRQGIQQVMLSSLESIIYRTLETEKCIQIEDDYFLSVSSVEGKTLHELFVTARDAGETRLFSAESAQLRIGPACRIIEPNEICHTKSGEIYQVNPEDQTLIVKLAVFKPNFQSEVGQVSSSTQRTIVISLDELSTMTGGRGQSASGMSLVQLNAFIDSRLKFIENQKLEMALESAFTLQTGNLNGFSDGRWNAYYEKIQTAEHQIRRAKIEPTRRLAFAFNCFFLTWVCAPFSLKRGGVGALMLICVTIVPLLLFYYPFTILMIQVVKETSVSPLILWLPNLTLFVFGIWLVRKAL